MTDTPDTSTPAAAAQAATRTDPLADLTDAQLDRLRARHAAALARFRAHGLEVAILALAATHQLHAGHLVRALVGYGFPPESVGTEADLQTRLELLRRAGRLRYSGPGGRLRRQEGRPTFVTGEGIRADLPAPPPLQSLAEAVDAYRAARHAQERVGDFRANNPTKGRSAANAAAATLESVLYALASAGALPYDATAADIRRAVDAALAAPDAPA